MKYPRLVLWLALCSILGLSVSVYTLRQERARDLRDIEGLTVRAATLQRENAALKALRNDMQNPQPVVIFSGSRQVDVEYRSSPPTVPVTRMQVTGNRSDSPSAVSED